MGLTFPADPPHDGLAYTLHTSSLFSPFQRVNPSFCLKDAESEIRLERTHKTSAVHQCAALKDQFRLHWGCKTA